MNADRTPKLSSAVTADSPFDRIARGHDHRRTSLGHALAHRKPDTAVAAGNNRHPVLQIKKCHFAFPLS